MIFYICQIENVFERAENEYEQKYENNKISGMPRE